MLSEGRAVEVDPKGRIVKIVADVQRSGRRDRPMVRLPAGRSRWQVEAKPSQETRDCLYIAYDHVDLIDPGPAHVPDGSSVSERSS